MAACPPGALNVTVGEPGRTDWYDEAEPKASSRASMSDPTLTVTWGCFTDAWMTLTSDFEPAAAAILSSSTFSRRAEADPRLATV
jgi:hypothetical protein